MNTIKDGGPAFPAIPGDKAEGPCCYWGGMSLRDWFAGMALQGILASGDKSKREVLAGWSYQLADAMLVELAKDRHQADSEFKKQMEQRIEKAVASIQVEYNSHPFISKATLLTILNDVFLP